MAKLDSSCFSAALSVDTSRLWLFPPRALLTTETPTRAAAPAPRLGSMREKVAKETMAIVVKETIFADVRGLGGLLEKVIEE